MVPTKFNGYYQRPLGKSPLKGCGSKSRKRDNIVLIDIESEQFPDIIVVDIPDSLRKKVGKNSSRRVENVINIDSDEEEARAGVPDRENDATTGNRCNETPSSSSSTSQSPNTVGEDRPFCNDKSSPVNLSKCKRTYSGNSRPRNRYGLSLSSESGSDSSSDSDCSDLECVGSFREQWEKAFLGRKKGNPGGQPSPNQEASKEHDAVQTECSNPCNVPDAEDFAERAEDSNPCNVRDAEHVDEPAECPSPCNVPDVCHERDFPASATSSQEKNGPFAAMPCDAEFGVSQVNCGPTSSKGLEPDIGTERCMYNREATWEEVFDYPMAYARDDAASPGMYQPTTDAAVNSCDAPFPSDDNGSHVPSSPQSDGITGLAEGEVSLDKGFTFYDFIGGTSQKKSPCQDPLNNGVQAGEPSNTTCVAEDCNPADMITNREKMKETEEYKRALEAEMKERQQQLQKQAEEAQRLKRRKRAEAMRISDMAKRQKQRIDEIRETEKKNTENMNLKEQIRAKVRMDLSRYEQSCSCMPSLLRCLGIHIDGGFFPSAQQVQAAYKKALLKFHPDRSSRAELRQQVEAEEKFKLISRMKEKFNFS